MFEASHLLVLLHHLWLYQNQPQHKDPSYHKKETDNSGRRHQSGHQLEGFRCLHSLFPYNRSQWWLEIFLIFPSLARIILKLILSLKTCTSHSSERNVQIIDIHKAEDLGTWCSILVGFFGLLRKKNLVPEDTLYNDPTKNLTVGNFVVDNERGFALDSIWIYFWIYVLVCSRSRPVGIGLRLYGQNIFISLWSREWSPRD